MDNALFIQHLNNPNTLIPMLRSAWSSYFAWEAFKNYDPTKHRVNSNVWRKDKIVPKPDSTGVLDEEGNPVMVQSVEYVNRISIPLQRLIVSRGASFLTGGQVNLAAQPENETEQALYDAILKTWKANKLQFKNGKIARYIMSETECAEIWYAKRRDDGTFEMRCNIYSPSMGYDLMPVFNQQGDLIAFGLWWDDSAQKTRHFDLYTDTELRRHINTGTGWELVKPADGSPSPVPLLYGKLPVIYYSAERSAWQIVQPLIDRLETILSNFADTNDYNGSPILVAKGQIKSFASKGESGKIIELEGEQSSLEYVTWDNAPQAIKLEIDTLFELIYTCTQTPNISFEAMKGLGDISGVAFDRIMIDAHLKARDQQNGDFGECIQRRLNFLKSALIGINPKLAGGSDLDISAEFTLFKIDDEQEKVDLAMKANGGQPVMSRKEAVVYTGISKDPEATINAIDEDMDEADARAKAKQPEPII